MPSLIPHPITSLVVRDVWSLANRQNQQKRGPSGNFQLPPAERHVSVPAGKRDSSQAGSSIASTMQGQNSTRPSSVNNSPIADITLSAIQQLSIITPTTTSVSSSRNTPAPSGHSQTDSTRRIVSGPASGIARTPTPLSCLENLPTPNHNPEARSIISNPLQPWATERNQRQRQW